MGQYAEFGKFRLENEGKKDLRLNYLKLKNYGTADLDESIENPALYQNGVMISSRAYMDRKDLILIIDDHLIRRGDSQIFSVKGQLIYAKNGEKIQLGIKNKEDIKAREPYSNFNAECISCEDTRLKTYTLSAGGLYLRNNQYQRASVRYYDSQRSYQPTPTRSYANLYQRPQTQNVISNSYYRPAYNSYRTPYFSSQSSPYQRSRNYYNSRASSVRTNYPDYTRYNNYRTNRIVNTQDTYSPGSKDVVFYTGNLNNRTPMEVEGLFFHLKPGSTAQNGFDDSFEDFKLYVNGRYESSASRFETRNGQTGLYFDGPIEIYGGVSLQVTGRVSRNAKTGDRLKLQLNNTGIIDPEYINSGDSVDLGNINPR